MTNPSAIDGLPEMLRPLARWLDEQHERGGIVGVNADTGEPVPQSLGAYYHGWSLLRDLEQVILRLSGETR